MSESVETNNFHRERAVRLFDEKKRKEFKESWGQELEVHSKWGLIKQGNVHYRIEPEYRGMENAVENFIQNTTGEEADVKLFKSILREKIIQGKEAVKNYNLCEIADFLPWVFSAQLLFEPFRSLLYCIQYEIPGEDALEIPKTVKSEVINFVAEKAIYESIKNGSSVLTKAKMAFENKHLGLITKAYTATANFLIKSYNYLLTAAKKGTQSVLNAFGAVGEVVSKIGKTIVDTLYGVGRFFVGSKTSVWKPAEELDKGTEESSKTYRSSIVGLITEITKGLRPYGEILINFGFLEEFGESKLIGNQVFYFTWEYPNLLMTVNSSYPSVYLNVKGVLTFIPEGQFTKNFLKAVITNDVIEIGAKLFSRLNKERTMTAEQREPLDTFYQRRIKSFKEKSYEEYYGKKNAFQKDAILQEGLVQLKEKLFTPKLIWNPQYGSKKKAEEVIEIKPEIKVEKVDKMEEEQKK